MPPSLGPRGGTAHHPWQGQWGNSSGSMFQSPPARAACPCKEVWRIPKPTGPNFIHPPPTPEMTLLGVGVYKSGGAYKIPAAWALKIYTPTPPPLKMPCGQKSGLGGGAYIISPWKTYCWSFRRFLQGSGAHQPPTRRDSEGASHWSRQNGPFETPSKTLQRPLRKTNPSETPSETPQQPFRGPGVL